MSFILTSLSLKYIVFDQSFLLPMTSSTMPHMSDPSHDRRQGKRFRLLGSHLDGTDIDDFLLVVQVMP
ncbi:MAG TPA: hypothetical protein VMT12_09295 [Syntrophales bacterium]|nr:hypothetical protein [Syntrophales bacterium]